jgi:hypothetical protein
MKSLARRGNKDREIADCVIARTDPGRTHIRVTAAKLIEHDGDG